MDRTSDPSKVLPLGCRKAKRPALAGRSASHFASVLRSPAVAATVVTTRRLQHEGIVDDDDAAAFRSREAPALHRVDDAVLGARRAHVRAVERRALHRARRGDDEVHDDAAREIRTLVQLLLVAEPDLVDVALDDAPDDFLRQRAADVRVAGTDARDE